MNEPIGDRRRQGLVEQREGCELTGKDVHGDAAGLQYSRRLGDERFGLGEMLEHRSGDQKVDRIVPKRQGPTGIRDGSATDPLWGYCSKHCLNRRTAFSNTR